MTSRGIGKIAHNQAIFHDGLPKSIMVGTAGPCNYSLSAFMKALAPLIISNKFEITMGKEVEPANKTELIASEIRSLEGSHLKLLQKRDDLITELNSGKANNQRIK